MIKRFFLLFWLLAALSVQGAISRVQSKTATTGATDAATLSFTFDATPIAGNYIIIAVAFSGTFGARATEQTGITWTEYYKNATNNPNAVLIIGRVQASIASATCTVTTSGASPIAIVAAEYTGTNLRADKQATNSGTAGTSVSTGATETTNSAVELQVAALSHRDTGGTTYSSPTGGFSIVGQTTTTDNVSNSDRSVALLEQISSSTGTPNAGATVANANSWAGIVLTLEETPTSSSVRIPTID